MDIPLEELHSFKDHPFRVVGNGNLRELAKNISEHGVVKLAQLLTSFFTSSSQKCITTHPFSLRILLLRMSRAIFSSVFSIQ